MNGRERGQGHPQFDDFTAGHIDMDRLDASRKLHKFDLDKMLEALVQKPELKRFLVQSGMDAAINQPKFDEKHNLADFVTGYIESVERSQFETLTKIVLLEYVREYLLSTMTHHEIDYTWLMKDILESKNGSNKLDSAKHAEMAVLLQQKIPVQLALVNSRIAPLVIEHYGLDEAEEDPKHSLAA